MQAPPEGDWGASTRAVHGPSRSLAPGEPVVTPGAEDPRVNGAAGPDANIKQLGENLFSDHVLAFELTSVLLIVAVAGTVVMTRKDKRGKADPS